MNRKTTTLLLTVGVLIAAGVAAVWSLLGRRAAALPVRTAPVERVEKLVSTLSANGTIHLAPVGKTAAATSSSQAMVALAVGETGITRLAQGMTAMIGFRQLAGAPALAGRVRKIGQMAQPEPGGGRVFKVEMAVDGPLPPQLREGMSCQAEFTLALRKNALVFPISALTTRWGDVSPVEHYAPPLRPVKRQTDAPASRRQGKPGQREFQGVFMMGADGMAHFRAVRTGLLSDQDVEVINGLNEGEKVITGPLATLRRLEEWTPVRPETDADRAAAEAQAQAKEKKSESRRDQRK